MPLSEPVDRKPVHTRAIECRSYAREDGLFDIEGHLTDIKAYAFQNKFRGTIEAGEPLHDMWLRITVGPDYVIRAIEPVTDAGPFEACPAILVNFQRLVGLKIAAGWNREVRKRVGGVEGCTHLVDLIRPLATVAFHTVRWSDSKPAVGDAEPPKPPKRRPPLNTCHMWASDGPVVKEEFPEFYTGDAAE